MLMRKVDQNSVFEETLPNPEEHKQLVRRKGGGGHGSSGHSSGRSSSSGGKGGPSVAKAHGASSTFTNSRGAKAISLSDSKTTASPYSDGGGQPFTLGSNSIFSGRLAGGGGRVRYLRHLLLSLSNTHINYRTLSMARLNLGAATLTGVMESMSIPDQFLIYSTPFQSRMDTTVVMRSGHTYIIVYHITYLPLF